jgi:periplasmic protein CpxP/Spy
MTKKLVTFVLLVACTVGAIAQDGERGGRGFGGGGQRRTIAERVAIVHQKFDSVFHFANEKQAKVDSAFAQQYRAQDALFAEMRANFTPGQQPDPSAREKMQEKNKELNIARDEKLQEILNEEEYKKWKNDVEPAMRPQRGQGGGRGGNGGNSNRGNDDKKGNG